VTTGAGLEEALAGVLRIVDATNAGTADEAAATAFFTAAAEHLQEAGARAGAELSIVGVDRLSTGYFAAKLRHEQAAQSGEVPVAVLRATQFHEFAGQILMWGRAGDLSRVPEMLVQPIAVASVATVLAHLALADGPPASVSEVAGPHVEQLVDMAARLAERRDDPVKVEGVADPSPDGQAIAAGALLPGPGAAIIGPTFQEWLDQQ
jgi:uncharacterized protein YbjT (DUF2867 family)